MKTKTQVFMLAIWHIPSSSVAPRTDVKTRIKGGLGSGNTPGATRSD